MDRSPGPSGIRSWRCIAAGGKIATVVYDTIGKAIAYTLGIGFFYKRSGLAKNIKNDDTNGFGFGRFAIRRLA